MKNTSTSTNGSPNRALPFDQRTTVQDILVNWPQTVPVFLKYRMLCVGCYVAPFHTVEDACLEHDVDERLFWRELAKVFAA